MRSHSKRKANKTKVIIVSDEQELPDGYIPVSGAVTNGQSLTIALPEKIVRENPKLANKLIEEAQKELFTFLKQSE